MIELNIQGIDSIGCCAYFSIKINKNTTIGEIEEIIKSRGYVKYRICDTMKLFKNIF